MSRRAILPSTILLLILTAVAPAGPAVAQPSDALGPLDVAALRALDDAVISPDGGHIAYRLSVPRTPFEDEDGTSWSELHVAGAEANSRPFIIGQVRVGNVAWRPDHGEITYTAKRDGDDHTALYAIPLAGGESRRLLAHGASVGSYAWSPDGTRLAFLADEPDDGEAEKLEKKGFKAQVYEETAEPTRLWLVEIGTDGAGEPRMIDLAGSASALSWSPAGGHLAVALAPTPQVDDDLMRRRIHFLDAESGAVVGEVDHAAKLGATAWATDGAHFALVAGEDVNDPSAGRLMVVPAPAGGAPRELVPGYMGQVESIVWRDAETVQYIGSVGVEREIATVTLAGAKATVVAAGEGIWSGLSLAGDGSAALLGESPAHPDELFRLAPGGTPERLTDSNPRLAEIRFAPQEVVKFTARDGLELEGILVHPRDRREGERYPLIMIVHGGPESHHTNGWMTSYSRPAQQAAAQGYAVFFTNYRGSTGRGVEFSKLSQGDPAGKEFDDVVDAVRHLVDSGLADEDRVGITGGSYGGYATAWGATALTEHFAAGVMFVGISNKISKAFTSDIPNELYLVHDRHWPWEDWNFYLERSPIFHAHKSKTPLLIMHGKDDTRVYPGQSLELYRILKLRGQAPVRLVFYPGEGHGNRKAAARLDYNLRLMRWMDHYLKGEGGEPPAPELEYPKPEEE